MKPLILFPILFSSFCLCAFASDKKKAAKGGKESSRKGCGGFSCVGKKSRFEGYNEGSDETIANPGQINYMPTAQEDTKKAEDEKPQAAAPAAPVDEKDAKPSSAVLTQAAAPAAPVDEKDAKPSSAEGQKTKKAAKGGKPSSRKGCVGSSCFGKKATAPAAPVDFEHEAPRFAEGKKPNFEAEPEAASSIPTEDEPDFVPPSPATFKKFYHITSPSLDTAPTIPTGAKAVKTKRIPIRDEPNVASSIPTEDEPDAAPPSPATFKKFYRITSPSLATALTTPAGPKRHLDHVSYRSLAFPTPASSDASPPEKEEDDWSEISKLAIPPPPMFRDVPSATPQKYLRNGAPKVAPEPGAKTPVQEAPKIVKPPLSPIRMDWYANWDKKFDKTWNARRRHSAGTLERHGAGTLERHGAGTLERHGAGTLERHGAGPLIVKPPLSPNRMDWYANWDKTFDKTWDAPRRHSFGSLGRHGAGTL